MGRCEFQPDLPFSSPQVWSLPFTEFPCAQGKKEGEESEFLNPASWDHRTHFWQGSAAETLQNQASLPQSYKINNGVRVPSAKTFLSPPTCIFLTAEDGELLLIVPRPTPLGPWRKGALSNGLSLWMGLCLWKFLPLQADRSPYVDHQDIKQDSLKPVIQSAVSPLVDLHVVINDTDLSREEKNVRANVRDRTFIYAHGFPLAQ